jgi:hypothetical protein
MAWVAYPAKLGRADSAARAVRRVPRIIATYRTPAVKKPTNHPAPVGVQHANTRPPHASAQPASVAITAGALHPPLAVRR